MGSEWKSVRLGDVVAINPRINFRRAKVVPFVSMDAIDPWKRKISQLKLVQGDKSGSKFQNGDILLARITPCLENGKTAYVDNLDYCQVGIGSTEFLVLRAIEGITDNLYVYYLSRSESFRSYAIKSMTGTSGRQRVQTSALADFQFNLPPLDEQKRIAHILGTLDDKIELNQRMNETLEAMARALFKAWFVDFEPVKAKMNGEPYPLPDEVMALFPDELVESELGLIPKGWEVKPLDQIADFMNGLACQKFPPREGKKNPLRVLKIRELRQGHFDANSDLATRDIKKCFIVNDGDVIFSWSGSLMIDLWSGGEGLLNQHLFKVTSKEYPKWFYFYWTKHHLAEFIGIAADKATTMGHIKREHLATASCVIPNNLIDFDGFIHLLHEKLFIDHQEINSIGYLLNQLINSLFK